jgi:hypothetical protein
MPNSHSNEPVVPGTRTALLRAIAASPLASRLEPESVVTELTLTPPKTKGASYRIIVTTESDAYDKLLPPSLMFGAGPTAKKLSDTFQGTARRAAKLSISGAPIEDFDDLTALIATLPSTQMMAHHNPPITTDKTSKRVVEEERNVRLDVWLYAASREDDNDFHLMLGRQPGLNPEVFMTMELSGLPRSDSSVYPTLKAARDAFKQFFGTNLPGSTYQFYDPPIPVRIEGSLFFDKSHSGGPHPGPQKLRDRIPTIWEVHPITSMVFEP